MSLELKCNTTLSPSLIWVGFCIFIHSVVLATTLFYLSDIQRQVIFSAIIVLLCVGHCYRHFKRQIRITYFTNGYIQFGDNPALWTITSRSRTSDLFVLIVCENKLGYANKRVRGNKSMRQRGLSRQRLRSFFIMRDSVTDDHYRRLSRTVTILN